MNVFEILKELADKIEELYDIIQNLYKLEESENKSKITLHFIEVTDKISDLIFRLDKILSNKHFNKEETNQFNKDFLVVARRCKFCDIEFFEAKENNLTNSEMEVAHNNFIDDIQILIDRIDEYNNNLNNKYKIYTFKQAVEISNKKMNEVLLKDIGF